MQKSVKHTALAALSTLAIAFAPGAQGIDDAQQFSDWTARCAENAPAGQQSCVLEQIVFGQEGNPVLRAAAGYLQEAEDSAVPAVLITVPLMVALQQGLAISIDKKGAFVAPYHHCNPEGCVAGLPLDEQVLSAFKKGSDATIRLVAVNGEVMDLTLSLRGFTAGYNALPRSN